jgi:hypothetical protein
MAKVRNRGGRKARMRKFARWRILNAEIAG